jgi:mannose-6-phosphate isomerase-like protein (cupin superfamily)
MKTKVAYPWGEMEWLAAAELGNAASLSVARMWIRPGGLSERHRHPNCDEAIFVQKGRLTIDIDGIQSQHEGGDCVVVRNGATHQIKNGGSVVLQLLLCYGAGQRVYEAR